MEKFKIYFKNFLLKRFQNLIIFILSSLLSFNIAFNLSNIYHLKNEINFLITKLDLIDYQNALLKFQTYNKKFPDNFEGLAALFQEEALSWHPEGYFRGLKDEVLDPWGNYYFYKKKPNSAFILKSLGEDGVESFDDIALDFYKVNDNYEINEKIINYNDEINYKFLFMIISLFCLLILFIKIMHDFFKIRKNDLKSL